MIQTSSKPFSKSFRRSQRKTGGAKALADQLADQLADTTKWPTEWPTQPSGRPSGRHNGPTHGRPNGRPTGWHNQVAAVGFLVSIWNSRRPKRYCSTFGRAIQTVEWQIHGIYNTIWLKLTCLAQVPQLDARINQPPNRSTKAIAYCHCKERRPLHC